MKASTSCYCSAATAATSTPNTSSAHMCACATSMPNISYIERSTSAPILVSDASIDDLQSHFKQCPRSKNSSLRASTNSSSPRETPRSCCQKYCPPPYLKKLSLARCAQNQTKEPARTADKAACVKQLYFNDGAKNSGGSSPRGQCIDVDCSHRKVKSVCSAGIMTKIEKEVTHRSCGTILKDSGATCSLVGSASSLCDASARAARYQNKLMATLQILQNKEDTIGVQAESLAVAEARIATLTDRANELKRELDRKTKEYQALRQSIECCKVEKNDVCIVTDGPMEDQRDIVNTLENNLGVIEDLYRECFYETARQENLIELLRSSYLDIRLMDKQKSEQIGRLQTVIDKQKWSLDKYQDIAMEVDGLKMEISNFLNSSTLTNNDSGMWERSEESFGTAPGVQEDLQDLVEQLLRLRHLLSVECECGLEDENMKLKHEAETFKIQVGELRGKICELECNMIAKRSNEMKIQAEIDSKRDELNAVMERLHALEAGSKEQLVTCESLSVQLRHTNALLDEKTAEVEQLREEKEQQANKIRELEDQQNKADHLIKENCKMRSEMMYLSGQVSVWRAKLDDSNRRLRDLDADLARARAQCAHINACYREKTSMVSELQAHLEEAHERGTALCGEARRAVCAVRHWMRRMRDKHREQEALLKERDVLIASLQQRLEERSDSHHTSASENTPTCSKCLSSRDEHSFCSKLGLRREPCMPSTSGMASCSSTAAPQMKVLRKKQYAHKAWMCDAAQQQPVRRDAASDTSGAAPHAPCCRHRDLRTMRLEITRTPRDISPTEELLLRVEHLSEALADGNRRWTRPHDARS